jgi:ABC-type branched-subunit amino acid transport system substrate-binding protein
MVPAQAGAKGSVPSSPTAATAGTPAETALQYEREGQYLPALKEFVNLSVTAPTKQQQEYYRLKALEIAENKLTEEELEKVSGDSDYGFIRGHALFRLGELALSRRDTSAARRYFSSVKSFLPESDLAGRSQDYISQIDSAKNVDSKTIGVVLPLSGKSAPVAQKTLRAVEMGLGLQSENSRFKLAVMDSEGNPDNARRSVERLVKEDSVIAIIGGLLSKTASAEVSKADELGVPSIVLSQKSGITDVGPSVFRNSLTSEMLVHHLLHVAMDEMGMKRFAIIYPNDPYGVEYANIFWDEVLARGGTIAGAQSYSSKETDFRGPVQRLVGTYYIEARMDEYKQRQKDLKLSPKSKRIEEKAEDILPPVVDFDAVFIPDNSKTLGQIAAFLSYAGVRGVKLLGTNLWNSPGLAKRAGNFSNNLVFVDGVLPQSENYAKSKFVREYKNIFGEDPGLIEIQAFDSASILRSLISEGASNREALAHDLANLKKFPGSLGPLEMSKNREVLRPMVALTLGKDGQVVPLANTSP